MSRKSRLVAEIDAELKKKVDFDQRSNREVTEIALRKELGDHRESVLDVRLEHKDRQKELVKKEMGRRRKQFEKEMQDYRRELEKIESEREEILVEKREITDKVDAPEEMYRNDLQKLFTEFANSRAILPRFRSDAIDIKEEHGKSLAKIESDLKNLAEESEYDIDDDRWTDRMGDGLA